MLDRVAKGAVERGCDSNLSCEQRRLGDFFRKSECGRKTIAKEEKTVCDRGCCTEPTEGGLGCASLKIQVQNRPRAVNGGWDGG